MKLLATVAAVALVATSVLQGAYGAELCGIDCKSGQYGTKTQCHCFRALTCLKEYLAAGMPEDLVALKMSYGHLPTPEGKTKRDQDACPKEVATELLRAKHNDNALYANVVSFLGPKSGVVGSMKRQDVDAFVQIESTGLLRQQTVSAHTDKATAPPKATWASAATLADLKAKFARGVSVDVPAGVPLSQVDIGCGYHAWAEYAKSTGPCSHSALKSVHRWLADSSKFDQGGQRFAQFTVQLLGGRGMATFVGDEDNMFSFNGIAGLF